MHMRKLWRRSIGATLQEISKIIGVSPSLVSFWEKGTRVPSSQLNAAWKAALVELEQRSRKRVEEAKHGHSG